MKPSSVSRKTIRIWYSLFIYIHNIAYFRDKHERQVSVILLILFPMYFVFNSKDFQRKWLTLDTAGWVEWKNTYSCYLWIFQLHLQSIFQIKKINNRHVHLKTIKNHVRLKNILQFNTILGKSASFKFLFSARSHRSRNPNDYFQCTNNYILKSNQFAYFFIF